MHSKLASMMIKRSNRKIGCQKNIEKRISDKSLNMPTLRLSACYPKVTGSPELLRLRENWVF